MLTDEQVGMVVGAVLWLIWLLQEMVPRRVGDLEVDDVGMEACKVRLSSQMFDEVVPRRTRVRSCGLYSLWP